MTDDEERRGDRIADTELIDADTDRAIARYCAELTAEADLARGDLAEIEDHLRALYTELRDAGVPRAQAITDACKRLGDPRRLAREHARVRSPFGVRLSRARSWSAALLLTPFVIDGASTALHFGIASPVMLELGMTLLVLAGVIARVTWARPIAIGAIVTSLPWVGTAIATGTMTGAWPIVTFAALIGALVFLAPWRRRELGTAAIALLLLTVAYRGAANGVLWHATDPRGALVANPIASIAYVAVIASALGVVLRARWAAILAATAALALAGTANGYWPLVMYGPTGHGVWIVLLLGSMVVGVVLSAIAAVMSWRTGRYALGTLRHILD